MPSLQDHVVKDKAGRVHLTMPRDLLLPDGSLPLELFAMTTLQSLNLSGLGLSHIPEQVGLLTNLEELSFANNHFRHLPPEIGNLSSLRVLRLGNNRFQQLPSEIGRLSSLHTMSVRFNELQSLPREIGSLSSLQTLRLGFNRLQHLPPEIGLLSSLESLALGNNELQQLPPEMGKLTSLRTLYLSDNQLQTIPSELGNISSLTSLSLASNQLQDLPTELGLLSSLQNLALGFNRFHKLPPSLGALSSLKTLRLRNNQLQQLPAELGNLSSLETLHLSDNQLQNIPPEIGLLSSLITLDLARNKLSSLPAEVGTLSSLHTLDLRDNELQQLPSAVGSISSLQTLHLEDNPMREIPQEVGNLSSLQTLELSPDLSFPPPDVIHSGPGATLSFLRASSATTPAYRMKIMMIGRANVGKTCLQRRLRGLGINDYSQSTDGIEVHQWNCVPTPASASGADAGDGGAGGGRGERRGSGSEHEMTISIWDCGGQPMYYETHQFFLTARCVYLLVWNPRETDQYVALRKWLLRIAAQLRDGEHATVIVVATYADEPLSRPQHVWEDIRRLPELRQLTIIDDDGTGEPLWVSCTDPSANNGAIDRFRRLLARVVEAQPEMGMRYPESYVKLADHLTKTAWAPGPVSLEEMTEIALGCGVQPDGLMAALKLMSVWGVIVLYNQSDGTPYIVPDPQWIIDSMKEIITVDTSRQAALNIQHGAVLHENTRLVWGHHYLSLLYLMHEFQLAYPVRTAPPRSIVPSLLDRSAQPPLRDDPRYSQNPETCTHCRFELTFIPEGMMSRFLVRTHEYASNDIELSRSWSRGAVLSDQHDNTARIEALSDNISHVVLTAQGPSPWTLNTHLVETMEYLLDENFPSLPWKRLIRCYQCVRRGERSPFMWRVDACERLLRRGELEPLCHYCGETVSIPLLLYGPQSGYAAKALPQIMPLLHASVGLAWIRTPSIFLITTKKNQCSRLSRKQYRIHLFCEHPEGPPHRVKKYKKQALGERMRAVAPYMKWSVWGLRKAVHCASLGSTVAPIVPSVNEVAKPIKKYLRKAEAFCMDELGEAIRDLGEEEDVERVSLPFNQLPHIPDGDRRAAEQLLMDLDEKNRSDTHWDVLTKVVHRSGRVMWLCDQHRKEAKEKGRLLSMFAYH